MSFRLFTLLSVFLGLAAGGWAQQAACKLEIQVGVISITGDVFRGLAAEDFTGNAQKKPVAVKSLAFDEGSRRVLFVVDSAKNLSADTFKAEGELIRTILAGARPEDTFALIAAHGSDQKIKFTSDKSAITLAVGWNGGNRTGKATGVLDSVMEGIEWFGAPQAGDAIVVIAADTEGNHKTNAKLVGKALEEHHIRMFGLALGPVATKNVMAGGSMTSTTSQGLAWTTPGAGDFVYSTGDEHFYPLTTNSGGRVLAAMNANPRRNYSMADARVAEDVRQKARSISKMISSFYRIQIEPPHLGHPEGWNLDIADSIRKHTQPMFVLYPHALGPC